MLHLTEGFLMEQKLKEIGAFLSSKGYTEKSVKTYLSVLRQVFGKLGTILKEFGLHDLRHSFAINCLDRGIDIEDVRRMLGHSSLRTTQIYLQCKTTNMKEIALRLEGNLTQ